MRKSQCETEREIRRFGHNLSKCRNKFKSPRQKYPDRATVDIARGRGMPKLRKQRVPAWLAITSHEGKDFPRGEIACFECGDTSHFRKDSPVYLEKTNKFNADPQ